ncbi:MAG: Trk system potassium transporter TrkA [Pseudomonadales bacterium]|nr:Trk system potassium transporter TrkA [Pseudomonadales bacterium]
MKIIILGAGQVGSSLAGMLSSESNDINIVDTDPVRLADLADRFDIRTVLGNASHPSTLLQAGAQDADMIIAVTNSDEINMIACQLSSTLFHTPTKIGRVREHDYLDYKDQLFCNKSIPIDVLISPEQLVTDHLNLLLKHQGALQVLNFANGAVQMFSIRIAHNSGLIGHAPSYLAELIPNISAQIVGIFRQGQPVFFHQKPILAEDDEVFIVTASEDTQSIIQQLSRTDHPFRKVMIAGGGNIGARLGLAIQSQYQVKIIERNINRCNTLAKILDNTLMIHGSASDSALLSDEGIDDIDFFCALTDNDETNIMASLLAKRLGAKKVMTLINNPAYVDLVQGGIIDIAVSPQQTTVGSILAHVRRGDMVNVHPLRQGSMEALEAVAHGERHNSKVVGRTIGAIKLPHEAVIGAVVREGKTLMAHQEMCIEDGDHIIMLLSEKKRFREVERLFQVGLTFF